MILIIQFGVNLSNAKAGSLAIGNFAICCELYFQTVKILRAQMHRPPDTWMSNVELGKLLRCEGNRPGFLRREFDSLREANTFDAPTQQTFNFMIAGVVSLGIDGQMGGLK